MQQQQQPKKIPALGRVAALGNLYSAHSDKFYPAVNLFSTEVTEDHYDETGISRTYLQYNASNSITEKLNHFDIGGEVSLSLLAGMIELSGSASYLSEEKENSNFSEMALLYSIVTVNHQIFSIQRMKINEEVLNDIDGATHVVVGIDWGAKCNISCRYERRANETKQEVEGKLGGLIKKLSVEIDAEGKLNEKDNAETNSFSFDAKSDVLKLNQIPKNFNEAVQLAVSLPEHVKEINGGKGIPIDYLLLPLDVVAKVCKKQLDRTVVINEIENDTIQRFKQIANEMEEAKLDINTLSKTLDQNDNWSSENHKKVVTNSRNQLDVLKGQFQSNFQRALEDVRAGKSESSILQKVIGEVTDIESGLPSIKALYKGTIEEVDLIISILQPFEKFNVMIFGKKKHMIGSEGTAFVLYLPKNMQRSQKLTDLIDYFYRIVKDASKETQTETKYAIQLTWFDPVNFDCPVIRKLKDGRSVEEDTFDKEAKLLKKCTVRVDNRKITDSSSIDEQEYELNIQCPLSYTAECPRKKVVWIHDKCGDVIMYLSLSNCFRCMCGTFSPLDATFRCNDPNHGMSYCKANHQSLKEIEKLKKKITNIFFFGESGVGKSTWINSIAKYLLYPTLEDAVESNDNAAIIPSQFSHTNNDGETVEIKIGDFKGYDNENIQTGASATRKPTTYLFDFDEKNQIRLIDTPGIGNTAGIQKDNEYFDMILHHMSYFNEIHGICILLKPNSTRLGIMLKFCIGELLTHLDKSAAGNIMFCFTNSRATFYQPGETLPVLKKMLEDYKESNVRITKENRFCLDNESFRLLACLQNGIKFSPEDIKAYSASWQRAASETHKMFQYVFKLKPHKTDETLSLNDTRKWIVELSRRIAEIQESIQDRIVQMENKKKELEDIKDGAKDFDELERLSEITVWTPEVVKLEYSRTICRHRNCTEAIKVHGAEILHTPTPCHDPCEIDSVTPGRPGDPELRHCRCFKDGLTCNKCGHHLGEHQNVRYNTIKVPTKTIDPETKQMIGKRKDKATIIGKIITKHSERIEAENQEMKTIMEISATFACFLTSHSLAFHNDGVEGHLDYLIDEKTKLGEREKVKGLNKMKKEYQTQKEIIEKAIKSSTEQRTKYDIDVEGAAKLKAKLFQLKYNGQTFKKMSEDIARVEADHNFKEVTYNSTKPKLPQGKQNNSHYLHQNNTAQGGVEEKEESLLKRGFKYVFG